MPRFHFHLHARQTIDRDVEGTDLPDMAAARSHATEVARELMLHTKGDDRCRSLRVEDAQGERQFDLLFADVDPRLAVLSPQVRCLVAETRRRLDALAEAIAQAQATRTETCMLLARARGKPQLIYSRRS